MVLSQYIANEEHFALALSCSSDTSPVFLVTALLAAGAVPDCGIDIRSAAACDFLLKYGYSRELVSRLLRAAAEDAASTPQG